MNYKIGHLIVICVALLLCVACGEQRNAVAVVYKEHFPIDTMLPIKTYPAEELVRPKSPKNTTLVPFKDTI